MRLANSAGGPSAQERELIYARARMTDASIQNIEEMIAASPARDVGNGALTNVVTLFDSKKNDGQRLTESHTCELIYAYELEFDPDVVGYHTQVRCSRIERITRSGHRHITSANLDFLVFRKNSVQLVECKPFGWLENQSTKDSTDWHREAAGWTHDPYANYAHSNQLDFRVWCAPEYFGVYLQNLEACYAVLRDERNGRIERFARLARAVIHRHPASIEELCELIEGFSARTALWMLATRCAYGPWRNTPVQPLDSFILYPTAEQAVHADHCALEKAQIIMGQPDVTDPILLASHTDLAKGLERLEKAKAAMRGEAQPSRRLKDLIRAIETAVAENRDPLSVCVTNYANSGNHLPRLLPGQVIAMNEVIAESWNSGLVTSQRDLYYCYNDRCPSYGVDASGKTSLYRRLRKENPTKRAIATGGFRGFHAIRPSTDARKRSLRPLGYGHTLHIDSSKFDNRTAPSVITQMPALAGTFYVGIDDSSGDVMADAFIFGSARTDGLAILLRNYVRRHKRLPRVIHVDRGPENKSLWLKSFANECVSIRWSPSAGSQWNGLAESLIKRVNSEIAHRLIGSTAPDQAGRKVDGRFKSYQTAKMSFDTIRREIDYYLYQDFPRTPGADGLTPIERRDAAIATFGNMGVPCEIDDNFLIKTSIPVDIKGQFDRRKGVRTEEGFFTSEELVDALRMHRPENPRNDCEDPTILWLFVGGRWLKAFHSRVQTLALCSPTEKLFDLMYAPIRRGDVRRVKHSIAHARFTRLQLANHARTAEQANLAEQTEAYASRRAEDQAGETSEQPGFKARRGVWDSLVPLCEEG